MDSPISYARHFPGIVYMSLALLLFIFLKMVRSAVGGAVALCVVGLEIPSGKGNRSKTMPQSCLWLCLLVPVYLFIAMDPFPSPASDWEVRFNNAPLQRGG